MFNCICYIQGIPTGSIMHLICVQMSCPNCWYLYSSRSYIRRNPSELHIIRKLTAKSQMWYIPIIYIIPISWTHRFFKVEKFLGKQSDYRASCMKHINAVRMTFRVTDFSKMITSYFVYQLVISVTTKREREGYLTR